MVRVVKDHRVLLAIHMFIAWALQASINCLPEDWRCPSGGPGCRQSREMSRHKTSASPHPGVSHIDVSADIVLRKQLYSKGSKPLDDDD